MPTNTNELSEMEHDIKEANKLIARAKRGETLSTAEWEFIQTIRTTIAVDKISYLYF